MLWVVGWSLPLSLTWRAPNTWALTLSRSCGYTTISTRSGSFPYLLLSFFFWFSLTSFSLPVFLPHLVLLSVLPSSLFLFLLLSHKPFSPLTLSYHFLLIAGNRQRSRITASDRHSEGITIHTTQHKHLYYKIKQCCCHVDQCWLFFVDNLDQCAVSIMSWGGQGEVCSNCGTHYRSCKTDQRRGVCHIIKSGWGYCFQLTRLISVAVVAAIMVFLKIWLNIHENQFLIIDLYKSLWKCCYS